MFSYTSCQLEGDAEPKLKENGYQKLKKTIFAAIEKKQGC